MVDLHPSPALLMLPGAARRRTAHAAHFCPAAGPMEAHFTQWTCMAATCPECTRAAMHLQCLLWHWPLQWCTSIAAMWRAGPTLKPATTLLAARAIEPAEPNPAPDLTEFDSRTSAQWSFDAAPMPSRLYTDAVADDSGTRTAESVAHGYGASRAARRAHARLRDASPRPHTTGASRGRPRAREQKRKTRHKKERK